MKYFVDASYEGKIDSSLDQELQNLGEINNGKWDGQGSGFGSRDVNFLFNGIADVSGFINDVAEKFEFISFSIQPYE